MLKKINEGRVKSDEGFCIDIIGRECMRYQEGNMHVDFTLTNDPIIRKTLIYVSDFISWDQPVGTPINNFTRKKIINNVQRAVKLLTGDFEVY